MPSLFERRERTRGLNAALQETPDNGQGIAGVDRASAHMLCTESELTDRGLPHASEEQPKSGELPSR